MSLDAERRSAVGFGAAVHLARFAIILAVVTLVPLVGITGWYAGLTANVACTVFAVWLVTRQGLWRASGFLTPYRSGWALLALTPFVLDTALWALPGGLEVDSPGVPLWAVTLLLVGVNEELISRVVVLDRLRRSFAPLAAAAVTGALFGLQHLSHLVTTGRDPGDVLVNVLLSGIAGFALASYQLRFAWIWPLMLLHAASDFTAIHATVDAPVAWYVAMHLVFVAVGVWLLVGTHDRPSTGDAPPLYRTRGQSRRSLRPPKEVAMKSRHLLALGVLAAAALPASASAHHDRPAPARAVLQWNAIAQREVVPPPPAPPTAAQPQPSSLSSMAFVQAAVYNAVVAIEGGYEPYGRGVAPRRGASVDAAVATAAHGVLVHYFPARAGQLDADLAAALAQIPEGRAKHRGAAVGREAAQGIIARRAGDGWFADIGFTMPAPAPGVWQLPATQAPLVPWLSRLRPFTLRRPDQFRPGPPPALSSHRYARARAEVESVGKVDSTERSAEQTLIARFYTSHVAAQYNTAYRDLAEDRELDAMQAARLIAMGNVIGADALIACFDAKYHYLFWRPVTAIPGFTPLLPTPAHPEYPSAHGCVTFAQSSVFKRFLGTGRIHVNLRSAIPEMPVRHFATVGDLRREIVNARVWGGIHFRFSNKVGGALGDRVASWALDRFFRPA